MPDSVARGVNSVSSNGQLTPENGDKRWKAGSQRLWGFGFRLWVNDFSRRYLSGAIEIVYLLVLENNIETPSRLETQVR